MARTGARKRATAHREAKEAVVKELGFRRGMTSSKVTANPETVFRALEKRAKRPLTPEEKKLIHQVVTGGNMAVHVALDEIGRKALLGTRTTNVPLLIHEYGHIAYFRDRVLAGRKMFDLPSEIISSSLQLDHIKRENPEGYKKRFSKHETDVLTRKHGKITDMDIEGMEYAQMASNIGREFGILMSREFNLQERREMRQELLTRRFISPNAAVKWYKKKLKAKQRKK